MSGIAFAILFAVGNSLWGFDAPDVGAPAPETLDFYREESDGVVIGATLSLLSIAAFALFASAVRRVLADAEGGDVLATTAFAGALLALAGGVGAETLNMVGGLRAADSELTESLAQSLFEISQILGTVAAGLGVAVFALATGVAALRSRSVLPGWLAIGLILIGLSLLTPAARILQWPGGAMVLIALVIGVVLLRDPAAERR